MQAPEVWCPANWNKQATAHLLLHIGVLCCYLLATLLLLPLCWHGCAILKLYQPSLWLVRDVQGATPAGNVRAGSTRYG
jgi:hypothetical protein